ncbi:MAG: four helix bundle protein [Nitrospirae bacterium]|nr:four helix bundle protein [Nitrospirota bacterium]
MARYEHLPIYKKAMDLAVYIENMVKGFSRYHKYSIGSDLRDISREIVRLIISANSSEAKLQELVVLRNTIEQLKVTIQICKEVKAFKSFSSFQYAAEAAVLLSRQSEGWIKSVRGKATTP